MQTSLFRKQAVEHQKSQLLGEILVLPKTSYLVIGSVITVWFLAIVIFLISSSYARTETVKGWLEPTNGVVKVYPEQSMGKIKSVLVSNGEYVQEGQNLLRISDERVLSSGSSLEEDLLKEYQRQQKYLSDQKQRLESIKKMQFEDVQMRISAAKQDLERLDKQILTVEQRNALIREQVQDLRKMKEKGHVAKTTLNDFQSQSLSLQSDLQALQREKIRQNNTLQLLNSQLVIIPEEYQNSINSIHTKLSEVSLKITQLNSRGAYIIKAPRDGVVTSLQANIGQKIISDKPLLSIVPKESDIEAKLLVPVSAVGFLEAGQEVELRYDAFPYQKFGLYKGKILQISESILLPNEIISAPVAIAQPVYLARAKLTTPFVNAYGKQIDLKSGMTLYADIKLGERSLLEWVFEPLFSLQGRVQ